jgi:hypothetical protein
MCGCKTSYPLMKFTYLGPRVCLGIKSHPKKKHSWIIDFSFPTLKCENDDVLLIILKLQVLTCHMKRSGWEKSLLRFWSRLGNFAMALFYLDSSFQSIVHGKYEKWSIAKLSKKAHIHSIFQAIFVRSLEVCFLP